MAYSADQLELLAHLEAARAEAQAWVAEDPENRFAGYSPVDLDWHAENGVFSIADLELQDWQSGYSDAYKDAYGFRPRHDTSGWTREDWKREYEAVAEAASAAARAEREEQDRNVESFKAEVAKFMELGASDVETAVEWVRDAYQDEFDRQYGDENLEYQLNVPFGFVKKYLAEAA